jgi:hypothetical protein
MAEVAGSIPVGPTNIPPCLTVLSVFASAPTQACLLPMVVD